MWTELNICESGRQMGCYRTFSFMVIKWGLLSRAPGILMVPFQEGIVKPTVSWFHALSQNPKWLFHNPPTRSLGLLSPLWMNLLWLLLSSSPCLSAIRDSPHIDMVLQFRGAVSVLGEQMLLGGGRCNSAWHPLLSLGHSQIFSSWFCLESEILKWKYQYVFHWQKRWAVLMKADMR